MKSFEHIDVSSIDQAVSLLSKHQGKARVLAGGTDLLGGLKDQLQDHLQYEILVNIKTIPDMEYLREDADGLSIGALTRIREIENSTVVREQFNALAQAAAEVASPQIRNMGTIGGNLCQRPRCWYYRGNLFDCYKKGGDFCFAVTGDNRFNCVIGGELCYIVHPSDTAVALLALDANAKIVGLGGEKVVPLDEFFIGPREDVLRENILNADELLVEIQVPKPTPGTKSVYLKARERASWDFATVSVAAVVTAEGGIWRDGRIVLGGVAPTPYRAEMVENALQGKNIADNIQSAAQLVATSSRPMSKNTYKVTLAQALVKRAVLEALV